MSHPGNDWLDELRFEEKMEEEERNRIGEEDDIGWWGEVEDKLRELTDIPYYLYKECREEGMSKEEAIEETQNRFWEK